MEISPIFPALDHLAAAFTGHLATGLGGIEHEFDEFDVDDLDLGDAGD